MRVSLLIQNFFFCSTECVTARFCDTDPCFSISIKLPVKRWRLIPTLSVDGDKVFTVVTTSELAARNVHILPPDNEKCLVCLLGLDTDYNEVVKLVNELYSALYFIFDYYNLPAKQTKNPPILSVQQCKTLLQIKCILPYDLWRDELEGEWTVGVKYPEDRIRIFGDEEGVYFNVYKAPPLAERN